MDTLCLSVHTVCFDKCIVSLWKLVASACTCGFQIIHMCITNSRKDGHSSGRRGRALKRHVGDILMKRFQSSLEQCRGHDFI